MNLSKNSMTWIAAGLCWAAPFVQPGGAPRDAGSISISGAFALYPLTVKWAGEFRKIHPEIKIDISAGGAGKGITDVLSGVTDIGLVSRDLTPEETKKGAFPIAVTKDAVIPTISAGNPFLKELQARGLKKAALNGIFITGQITSWGQAGLATHAPVHVYTRSDAAGAAETWALYFGKKQEDLQGVAVYGDPGLALAVKKDPAGIGYNNIVYVYDAQTRQPTNGVVPLPIDLNNNGRIDPDEQFYGNIDQLTGAIAAGKYPAPPARDLYFVTKGGIRNPAVKSFIQWVLTEGQKYVKEAGYINLSAEKINAGLKKL
ncbi:MAG: substrate-binding domain-containing protein [Bacteroidota bacterium]|nr:substrate-binding domain-containing protein [Bacteroidota bacterium]MDP4217450.1 substrate-binding domain-containing protein [Bacteroidota bacterium]MDP4246388.1 substrate-binding domain-containing protein [Bacteroidota bacterium]MDP4255411.1 substrate-binding domain-containing protein [Bacteroidota bacterium]MDP4259246.1 substrate-binding domain-containing protein [Bacteroidota bacterium]